MGNTKKKSIWKIILIVLVILFLLVAIGIGALVYAGQKMASKMMMGVTTAAVTTGDLQEVVTANGTITSEKSQAVFSQVSAYVDQVNAQVGDAVKAGDCMITFKKDTAEEALQQATLQQTRSSAAYQKTLSNNSDNSSKLKEANVNLDVLKQQISDWEANIQKMQDELEKSMRDTNNGYSDRIFQLSQRIAELQKKLATLTPGTEEYARVEKELDEAQKELAQLQHLQQGAADSDAYADLKKKIQIAQQELAEFKEYEMEMKSQKNSSEMGVLDQYDRTQLEVDNTLAEISFQQAEKDYQKVMSGIVADFDGIVVSCAVMPGSSVAPGMQVITLESSKDVKVVLNIPQVNLEKVEVGQKAEVKLNSYEYVGTVSRISRVAVNIGSGASMMQVEVHIDNPDDRIILDMDSKVEIMTRQATNVLMVPVEAIYMDKEGEYVYIVKADNTVEKRYVKCGITADMKTEIQEGLSAGEQVVIDSMMDLVEGMMVKATPENDAE